MFQQPSHIIWYSAVNLQVSQRWCWFTVGSVNLLTTTTQHGGTVPAVSFLPMSPQHHVEEQEVKHSWRLWRKMRQR